MIPSPTQKKNSVLSPRRGDITTLVPVWVHEGRSLGQADVCAYEIEGRRLVVKDFRPRPWLVRRWWGRWVLRREWKRLERLQGIAGIPRLFGWVDADAFAMEWIAGERLPHSRHGVLEPPFFERLERLVAEMHARGVAHGDLRRKNVLADRDQRPYLIDFATAHLTGANFLRRRLFERICRIDRLKIIELKADYCPDALTEDERRSLEDLPLSLRLGHFARKKVYRPFIKPSRWRRRWKRIRAFLFGQRPKDPSPPDD
jgi:predicted Ser/Thr protein kinase